MYKLALKLKYLVFQESIFGTENQQTRAVICYQSDEEISHDQ